MATNPLNYVGVGDVGTVANTCVNETAGIIAQCNAYAGDALTYGLVIGALAGVAGTLVAKYAWERNNALEK